jgi:hypothetical protein
MKEVNHVFGALEEPDVEALMHIGIQQQLHVSDQLLTEGDDNDAIYLVLDGELSVSVKARNSAIAYVGKGEIVGEMSLLESEFSSPAVMPTTAPKPKARPIPRTIKDALETMLSGKARNLTQAAKSAGISREYLSRTLSARPGVVQYARDKAARVLGIGASVAAAKMLELLNSSSSRVQFESSRFVLGAAGIGVARDANVNVSVGIELKAGYVIDLSEPGQPTAKIVVGAVIDAKPVE